MNNKTKAITGVSVIGGFFVLFKLWHFVHTIYTVTEPNNNQAIPVTIITTDSTGKKDTLKMEDYLKQYKNADTIGKY